MMSCTKSSCGALAVAAVVLSVTVALSAQNENRNIKQPSNSKQTVKLQPLNLKLGLWETTFTFRTAGEMPIPSEMLTRLSPEQRARIEERMKVHSAANTRSVTDQKCVTKEDLEIDDFGQSKEHCIQTILTSTSSRAAGTLSCEVEGMKIHGKLEIEAVDQTHVQGTSHGTVVGGGHTEKVDTTFASKWLRESCGKVR